MTADEKKTQLNVFNQYVGEDVPHWNGAHLPGNTILEGRFVRLELLDPARHASALIAAYSRSTDERDWTYLPASCPQTLPEWHTYLQKLAANPDRVTWCVIDKRSEQPVGTCALLRIDCSNGCAEIGGVHWSVAMQNQVTGSESIFLLLNHLFEQCGFRRCEWKCDSLNLPSRSAAERFGFRYEGIFRQAMVVKGRNRDTAWFAMTDQEWPYVCDSFHQWLSVENMDDKGVQKRSLKILDSVF